MQAASRLSGSYGDRPPARRKACGQCFKGKRRCDQQQPKCSRCKNLQLECRYLLTDARLKSTPGSSAGEDLQPEGGHGSRETGLSVTLFDGDNGPSDNDLQFLDVNWTSSSYNGNFNQEELPDYCLSLQQPTAEAALLDHIPQDLQNEIASRLHYGVDVLKKAPSQMVLENSTPWSHPLLYKDHMPKSISDAYATCAIYMHKNAKNEQMVLRGVATRAAELLTSHQNTTPVETLARVQSLLLYQIIRLFDGDIRLRAQSEAAMADLACYIVPLTKLVDDYSMAENLFLPSLSDGNPPSSNPLYASSQPPSHATWIFQESCRRTHLASQFFLGTYKTLRGGGCASDLIVKDWTICAPLWNAPSEFDFRIAWRERKRFVVRNLNFKEVLRDAMPEDVDENGKIFLVGNMGLDNAREWFYQRGGTLIC